MESENTSPDGTETETPSEAATSTPNFTLRIIVATVIALPLIALMQWLAPTFDHQYANMGSVIVGIVAIIYALIQLHLAAMQRGRRWIIPGLVTVIIVSLLILLRFDGFNGEMMPQFKPRFGQNSLELRAVSDTSAAEIIVETEDPAAVALANSLEFLGNGRTGIIDKRMFAVPSNASEVKTLWNQGIGKGWSAFAVSSDRAVTLEQREELECVTCYRLLDGELLWMQSHEAYHQNSLGGVGPRSTPTIVDDRVFAQGATGRVWCLDLLSGEIIWSVDLLEMAGWDQLESETAIAWGRAGSPLIVTDSQGRQLCIVPFGGPETDQQDAANQQSGRSLIALEAESGKKRWTAGEDQISFASPGLLTLAGKPQIVSVNEVTITGHDIDSGKQLWDFDWPGQSNGPANCAMVVPAGENRFLIGKGYGGGSALVEVQGGKDSWTAEEIWSSTRILKTKFTHACIEGDIAYAISNGSLEAVNLIEEQRLWSQPRRSRFGQGQILLIDDTIVAQSESGEVAFVAVNPNEYQELIRIPAMDSITWNLPTVAGRHLLVRNDRQAVCFLLPARGD